MTTQTQPSSTGAATATPATPPTKGTLSTPLGPITWEKASDGSITAVGNGQKFTSHGSVKSDGSWAQQANYAKTGQTSYLAMGSTGDVAGRKVQLLISAGSSRLTLTVSNINAGGTSGTGTLSGTWNGAVVQWTGQVNLTSNPFVSNPIAGWPKGAFATELQMAAFFAPLGNVLAQVTPRPPAATPNGTTLQPRDEAPSPPPPPSTQDILVQAGWACLGAMLGAGVTGPASLGLTLVLACAGGAIASAGSNINTWVNNNPPPVAEPPPVSVPSDPEPTGPITVTQPNDPPPGDDDGSGSQSSTGSDDGGGAGDGGDEGGEGDGGGGEGDGGGEGGGGGGGHGIDDNPPIEQD